MHTRIGLASVEYSLAVEADRRAAATSRGGSENQYDPSNAVTVVEYDPATGNYIGPDGKLYTQSDLSQTAPEEQTWQSMLIPPTGN